MTFRKHENDSKEASSEVSNLFSHTKQSLPRDVCQRGSLIKNGAFHTRLIDDWSKLTNKFSASNNDPSILKSKIPSGTIINNNIESNKCFKNQNTRSRHSASQFHKSIPITTYIDSITNIFHTFPDNFDSDNRNWYISSSNQHLSTPNNSIRNKNENIPTQKAQIQKDKPSLIGSGMIKRQNDMFTRKSNYPYYAGESQEYNYTYRYNNIPSKDSYNDRHHMWSLGVMMMELCTQHSHFHSYQNGNSMSDTNKTKNTKYGKRRGRHSRRCRRKRKKKGKLHDNNSHDQKNATNVSTDIYKKNPTDEPGYLLCFDCGFNKNPLTCDRCKSCNKDLYCPFETINC